MPGEGEGGRLWWRPQALSALGLSGGVRESTDDCSSGSSSCLSLQEETKIIIPVDHSALVAFFNHKVADP